MGDSPMIVESAEVVGSTSVNTHTNGSIMNARSLAQEAMSWYFDHMNPYEAHSINVKTHLRGPIIALTARLLMYHDTTINDTTVIPKIRSGLDQIQATKDAKTLTTHSNGIGLDDKEATTVRESNSWKNCMNDFGDVSFQELFESGTTETLMDQMNARTKARLDAFIDGVALAVVSDETPQPKLQRDPPQRQGSVDSTDLSLIEGLVGFRSLGLNNSATTMNVVSSIKRVGRSNSITGGAKTALPKARPQLGEDEIVTRIELYLRSLSRVVTYQNECVVEYEPLKALKTRTKLLVLAFVNTVGTVRHVNPVLTRLLVSLTKELLAVPTLSENLMRIIRNIVSSYVHATSFASLAFLSSPESSADQRLTPAIMQYLVYLQKNSEACERDCEVELMLSTVIDPQLRLLYKNAEFQSIGHLLEVYQSHRNMLQNIEIPPRFDRQTEEERIQQAMKDIPREVIAVNGSVLPRVTNRVDLNQLLTSALNIRPVYTEASNTRRRRRIKNKKPTVKSLSDGTDLSSGISGNEAEFSLSEASADTDDSHKGNNSMAPIARRKFPTTEIVDLLTKRLLLAISRSGTMGDAYFVVRDLFGGDDVEVVPSAIYHVSGVSSTNMSSLQFYPHPTTIDIFVRLASVTIKSHASFDVYPKSMVGDCEPLIQIHATTTETIALQEIRTADGSSNVAQNADGTESTTSQVHLSDRILQERVTDKSGYRLLSIRPALYEKVSVWHTPS